MANLSFIYPRKESNNEMLNNTYNGPTPNYNPYNPFYQNNFVYRIPLIHDPNRLPSTEELREQDPNSGSMSLYANQS